MVSSSAGKSSPLKPPPPPIVTIVDPIHPRGLNSSLAATPVPSQVNELPLKDPVNDPEPDIPLLGHSSPLHNPDCPLIPDPLHDMDEDLMEDSKDNDCEDSQEFMLDEEEMGDTFLNQDTIQEVELSTDSSKRRKIEEGEEGLSKAPN